MLKNHLIKFFCVGFFVFFSTTPVLGQVTDLGWSCSRSLDHYSMAMKYINQNYPSLIIDKEDYELLECRNYFFDTQFPVKDSKGQVVGKITVSDNWDKSVEFKVEGLDRISFFFIKNLFPILIFGAGFLLILAGAYFSFFRKSAKNN